LELPRSQKRAAPSLKLPSLHDTTIEQVERFTDRYHHLTELEIKIETREEPRVDGCSTPESHCEELSDAKMALIRAAGGAYESAPGHMSVFILSLFRLWVRLDRCMAKACPLTLEYHPVFTPELLDVLHLQTATEMRRLREIQRYIHSRCSGCKNHTTIFTEPKANGFAVKYVSTSKSMQELNQKIKLASDASRLNKKTELERWQSEYDEHSLGISGGTCKCTVNRDGIRQVKGCTKCWHYRVRNRMEIYAHEDFLPEDEIKAAAVIFELGIPKSFAAYRNATWKIMMMAYPTRPQSGTPIKLLNDYEPLKNHVSRQSAGITIASTSKSFRGTHYKVNKKNMRASKNDDLYPNGLKFALFDTDANTWIKDFDKSLTFQHVCGVNVPLELRSSVIPSLLHPPTVINGPSSYETVH
jgi:hypothetical protein